MMVSGLLFLTAVCFGVPLAGMVLVKRRWGGRWSVFFIGALSFFVSQICLRLPLLEIVLPQFGWFHLLKFNIWGYGLFLGATAALFENTARWTAMKLMKRSGRFGFGPAVQRGADGQSPAGIAGGRAPGLAYGLGHGGIEAALLVGVNAAVLLFVTISGGGALLPQDVPSIWASGAERLFTMAFHTGAALIVLYGVLSGRELCCFALSFLLHTATDAAVVILPGVFGVGMLGMELWIALMGSVTLAVGWMLFKKGTIDKRQIQEGM